MRTWSRQPNGGRVSPRVLRFAELMRTLREARGWSRGDMAAELAREFPEVRMGAHLILALELGRRATLTVDEAVAVAGVLNVSVRYMIGEDTP